MAESWLDFEIGSSAEIQEAIEAGFSVIRDELQRTHHLAKGNKGQGKKLSEDHESASGQSTLGASVSNKKEPLSPQHSAPRPSIDKACQSGVSVLTKKPPLHQGKSSSTGVKSKGQAKPSLAEEGSKNQKVNESRGKKPMGRDDIKFLFQSCSTCAEIHHCCSHESSSSLLKNANPEVKLNLSKKWENLNFSNPKSKGHLRIWLLLLQNAKAEVLLKRSETFEQILKSQALVTNQQMAILEKASDLGKRYSRNMSLIMRLGFCPLELQDRSEGFTKGLNRVYKMIYDWDGKMDELVVKSVVKDKKAVLEQVFRIFPEEFRKEVGELSDEEFAHFCMQMGDIPEILSKKIDFQDVFQEMELMDVDAEWQTFQRNVQKEIQVLEKELKEFCVEFGVTRPPAPGPRKIN